MDTNETKRKLAEITEELNNKVYEITRGKHKRELDEEFNKLFENFAIQFENMLKEYGVGYESVVEYFEGQLPILKKAYQKEYIDDKLFFEITSGLIRENNKESENNIDALSSKAPGSKDQIQEEVKRNSNRKRDNITEINTSLKNSNGNEQGRLDNELEDLFDEMRSVISRIASSRGMDYEKTQERLWKMRNDFRRLKENTTDGYLEILNNYLDRVLNEFDREDTELHRTSMMLIEQLEITGNDQKDSKNPWEVSQDIKDQIAEAGKTSQTRDSGNQEPKKDDKEDYIYPGYL